MAIKSYVVNWPLKLDDQLYKQGDVIEQEEQEVAPLVGGVLSELVPDPPINTNEEPVKKTATKPKSTAKTKG